MDRFTDDDKDDSKPSTGGRLEIPSRQKLPKGKNRAPAKRVKELTGKRTSTARYWQLSDGRVEAELSAQPLAYKAGKSWKSIDTKVKATESKGFRFANTTNSGRSWFGKRTGELLRFAAPDGRTVTLGLDGADKALHPTADGTTVRYKDAIGDADLEYLVGRGQVKENIVLDRAPKGPVSYAFTLDAAGLTPKARKDGSVALYGELPNTPVMVIPAPYMTDAKKDPKSPTGGTYSSEVTQKLTRDGKGWKLTVTPSAKWLAAKGRQYPVKIDPTITIAPDAATSQDTMVLSDQPAANFNNTWKLSAGKTDTGVARSLVKFPLTGIPAGTTIDEARLELYYDQSHTTNGNDVTMEAHRATGPWDESTATWSNTSALSGELSGTTVQIDDGDAGTAAVGEWPRATTTGGAAIGDDFAYNKNTATGETYTWQPRVKDTASYRVEAHYPPATDGATAAPYTITHRDGTEPPKTVNQSGSAASWKALGATQYYFAAGNAGKIVLGDTGSSTTRNIADALRLVNPGQIVKNKGEYNSWHAFPVTDTVQKWTSGTATNHGFVIQAKDDGVATTPTGGPRYEAGDGSVYGGETSTIPRLTVTYGKTGTTLNSPTVVHSTGPELSWKKYTNTTGDTGLDIVEYQLHRSTQQTFTPSAATLVAPVSSSALTYTDTTAVPTPDSSANEIGKSYHYQLAVKTKDGSVLGSPTRVVGIPKAGRTMKIIQGSQGGVTDTTLSSQQPNTNQDAIKSWDVDQSWLSVGNNSGTYGKTRAALKFPTTSVPATATVLDSKMYMWGAETTTDTDGAIYGLHALNRDFDETTATWNNADASTAWSTAGGDMSGTVSDTVADVSEVGRHWWDATSLTQGWVKTPADNKGVAVRLKDETASGPQERTLFLSAEAQDTQLRPYIQVIYVDSTTEDTYYAPQTPARMTPNTTYTVEFTVTNTTSAAWAAGERELSYTWKLPDGTDATTGGNQLETAVPALLPGKSATIQAKVQTPVNSDSGSKRTEYTLGWDVRKVSDGSWLSAGSPAIAPLKQSVAVEDPTSNALGMEKFYAYTGKNTGAGSSVMNNLAYGNSVWQYNAFNNPGRGLNTFFRMAYNSLDTSDTVSGHGWSMQASGPIRMGAPLEMHPKPKPTEIRLPDGDGTTHVFRWDAANSAWKAPAGVHYKLTAKTDLDCTPAKDPIPDAWTLTRPDGTRFLFGCDGYMTSTVDKNGNTQLFTYEERKSNNKPTKFLKYITDPSGRQTLTVDYWDKGQNGFQYVNDAGVLTTDSGNLNNSKIYDHIRSATDVSGRKIEFYYTAKGLLGQITDGAGSSQPKNFKFTYDATQGNKNVKLVKATDPRGKGTSLAYNEPKAGDDPKYHWWTKAITDRLGGNTGYAYAANATNAKFTDTEVTDAEAHTTSYTTDDFGRPVRMVNARSEPTQMSWDADNNVTYLEEANGAKTAYCYDQKTGYPLWQRDAEQNKSGVPGAAECAPGTYPANSVKYAYQTRLDGYSADLVTKTSAEGRQWQFGYTSFGNLKTVTDPLGATTATADDYTTKYEYDAYGQLAKAIDARGNPTTNSEFGPTGYPAKITDALGRSTSYVYDERGQVTEVTDALGKKTTQTYDTYGRPLVNKVPKDQAAGVFITTPAPQYDANDNITESTSPNGAVSTAVYDAADQVTEATAPDNNTTDRTTRYTYDKVGNAKTTTEPKGTLTTSDATDYVTTNHYDSVYQLTSVVNAKGDKVSYEYDDVGNSVLVVDPKRNATSDTADYTSKISYDLNHRVTKVTDALGKYTTRTYDRDSLVTATTDEEQVKTELVYDKRAKLVERKAPYDGTVIRSTKFEYDQVGNNTKATTPRGTATSGTEEDFASRIEYDALNRPVKQFQPYNPADSRYNSPNVYTETSYDEVGRVKRVSLPPSATQTTRNDTDYTYFDNGWAKTSTDPWDIRTSYGYDDLGQQTKRTLTGAGGSPTRTQTASFWPDGSLKTRTDAPSAGAERKNLAYAYDANGNLTSIDDTSSGAKIDAYTMTYTGLNQVDKVTEALAGEAKKSTAYTYNANSAPETVTHPDQFSHYFYDLRDQVKTVKVGKTASDATPEVTEYTYTDRGQKLKQTKANKNTVDFSYFLDGAVKTTTEKKADDTLVASHTYAYDLNGNKARDTAKKMDADDHAALLESATEYTYDPVDRIAKAVKSGNGAGTETYVHDDNANVISQNIKGEATDFAYDRNRLLTATTGGFTASYGYDAFGRLDKVTGGGKTLEDNDYDGFDHVIKHTKLQDDGTSKSTTYAFDPLDRTTAKTEGGKTTDYNYLGTSGEVLDERVAGEITKSYQYSPWGERLSQIKHTGGGGEELGVYGYNSHTDAETLTDGSGDTKATYGYTAYGNDDKSEFTGVDKPEETQPDKEAYNPYRFNGKRWDASSGTYDMGFRDYSPGLNRFTTRDMYNGALADARLGADPFTGNRYAFTGGNPVSNVELDGHMPDPPGGSPSPLTSATGPGGQTVFYDAYGIPHVIGGKAANTAEGSALQKMNDDLKTSGLFSDGSGNGTGEVYFQQDADSRLMGKGVFTDADGNTRMNGTTSDFIKVSYQDGKIVDVLDFDATSAKSADKSLKDITSDIDGKMDPTRKKQANNVVFVAASESQAQAVAQHYAGNEKVRVIHPASGFDSRSTFVAPLAGGGADRSRISPKMKGFKAFGIVGGFLPFAQPRSYFESFGFLGGLKEMTKDALDPWGFTDPPPEEWA
ncbi:DNRLRE domain-containing protein [Streptomyces sp. NPDC050658]